MTDLDALIADNRRWVRLHRENKFQREAASRMARVLDELEDAEAALAQERRVKELYKGHARKALADRDAALAVIEKARGMFQNDGFHESPLGRTLSSVPADVLRERDRQVAERAWDEGRGSVGLDFLNPIRGDGTRAQTENPYRIEQNSEGIET